MCNCCRLQVVTGSVHGCMNVSTYIQHGHNTTFMYKCLTISRSVPYPQTERMRYEHYKTDPGTKDSRKRDHKNTEASANDLITN